MKKEIENYYNEAIEFYKKGVCKYENELDEIVRFIGLQVILDYYLMNSYYLTI